MYRRLLVIASLVAAVGATAAVPAVAKQSCGTTALDQGGRASVTIVKGHVSCAAARGIVKLYGSNAGTPHNTNGPHSQMYTTYPGGWWCGPLEHGYSACGRGSMHHPRDLVWLTLVY